MLLMSGCGYSHKSAYCSSQSSWVQFWGQGSYRSECMVYQSMCMLNEVSSDASHAHFTIACHRFVSK